jgi:hypothetical protein
MNMNQGMRHVGYIADMHHNRVRVVGLSNA